MHDIRVGEHSYRDYEATGNGGQILIVVPELELTVAFAAGNYKQGEHLEALARRDRRRADRSGDSALTGAPRAGPAAPPAQGLVQRRIGQQIRVIEAVTDPARRRGQRECALRIGMLAECARDGNQSVAEEALDGASPVSGSGSPPPRNKQPPAATAVSGAGAAPDAKRSRSRQSASTTLP